MTFEDIVNMQQEFDKEHGWKIGGDSLEEFIINLNSDIVGFIGEVGEFSNIIKKIKIDDQMLNIDSRNIFNHEIKEEIVDIFIYLIRISMYFDIDFEKEYKKKLLKNRDRFKKYEKKD